MTTVVARRPSGLRAARPESGSGARTLSVCFLAGMPRSLECAPQSSQPLLCGLSTYLPLTEVERFSVGLWHRSDGLASQPFAQGLVSRV
jgi:hypothetical protein